MKRIILVLLIATISCAHPRHVAVVLDQSFYETLNSVHETEQQILRLNEGWTLEQSQNFNIRLLPAVAAGREFNRIIGDWRTGQPMPAELHDAINSIMEALKQVTTELPDGFPKTQLTAQLTKAQTILLSTVNMMFSFQD